MAILSKGQTFAAGDQVTHTKLNNLVDAATFASGAVDDSTTQLSSGSIIVKDGGITTAKLSTGAPTWDGSGNVTATGGVTATTGTFSGAVSAGTYGAVIATTVTPSGAVLGASTIKSSGATSGIGYATGAGGTVTQITSKSTSVTLNKICGQITTDNASLSSGAEVTFAVACTQIAAGDCVIVNHASGGTAGRYGIFANTISAGVGFSITITNLSTGALSEALVINYAIIKAVTS